MSGGKRQKTRKEGDLACDQKESVYTCLFLSLCLAIPSFQAAETTHQPFTSTRLLLGGGKGVQQNEKRSFFWVCVKTKHTQENMPNQLCVGFVLFLSSLPAPDLLSVIFFVRDGMTEYAQLQDDWQDDWHKFIPIAIQTA